ncbi:MAG: TonB-dependent receptor [Gammaproteobacteria bacterium]|nr:TonB-dependent receptor [Gammaproteobacteria bacterium]
MYAPAKQEQLDAFELGSKYTAFGGYAQINGAVYYYLYKDKQLLGSFPDPLFGQLPVLQNAPEARVYGAEFDITAEPLEGLSIVASGAYVDTEIREYEGTDELGNEVDFAGRPFNYAPKFETSLLLHYVHGLTHTLNFVLGADYNWTDDTNATLAGLPDFRIPEYSLVNARIGLESADGRWKAGLWGRNLTDTFIVNNVINPGDDISRRTGMPRTYGLSLAYFWNR